MLTIWKIQVYVYDSISCYVHMILSIIVMNASHPEDFKMMPSDDNPLRRQLCWGSDSISEFGCKACASGILLDHCTFWCIKHAILWETSNEVLSIATTCILKPSFLSSASHTHTFTHLQNVCKMVKKNSQNLRNEYFNPVHLPSEPLSGNQSGSLKVMVLWQCARFATVKPAIQPRKAKALINSKDFKIHVNT